MDVVKSDFGEVDKAMIQVVEIPWKPIFLLLAATKYNLGEVDQAKVQVVDRPCELICELMASKKRLGRSLGSHIQVGEWPREFIIYLLEVLKLDFGEVDEAMIQTVKWPCEIIFYLLGIQKATWTKWRKWFHVGKGP
jgi:hypothetical protein